MNQHGTTAPDFDARLADAVQRGLDAFWNVIADEYGADEIPAGDVPPGFEDLQHDQNVGMVHAWMAWNASDAFRATFPPSMDYLTPNA
jgi:hypothetical protein